jgi:hypothetical protein
VLARLRGRPHERQVPVAGEEDDPVAHVDVGRAVRREDDRRAGPRQSTEEPQHLTGGRGVETGRRLVEEERRGAGEQLDRDARPLALPAGQRPDTHGRPVGQVERGERLVDRPVHHLGRRDRGEPELRGVPERARQRQVPVDDVVLRHVADVRPVVRAGDAHLARGRGPDADHRLQQRRLPGAAATDDGDDLAGGDRERDVVQRGTTLGALRHAEHLDGSDEVGRGFGDREHAPIVRRPRRASLEGMRRNPGGRRRRQPRLDDRG